MVQGKDFSLGSTFLKNVHLLLSFFGGGVGLGWVGESSIHADCQFKGKNLKD